MKNPYPVFDHQALKVVAIPAFDDNVIWLIKPAQLGDELGALVCVVDPGDAAPVIDYCKRHQLVPESILLTHHHADHTGGVAEILAWVKQVRPECDVRVYGPAAEEIPPVNHPLKGGETFSIGSGIVADVLSVAGHTRGHLAYLIPKKSGCHPPALLSGDLLFGLGCGRLFEGPADQMFAALGQVARLDPATRIYCAHEYTALNLPFALKVDPDNADLIKRGERIRALRLAGESTLPLLLAEELATNPFLRADQPALAASACLAEEDAPNDVFAALRKMRDHFKST
ncbi:MAG: hydroxyacylglutathione hydrolase [Fluviibacter sp.]